MNNEKTRVRRGETRKIVENKNIREFRLQQQREEKNFGGGELGGKIDSG